jgi:hypothetical protein
MSVDAVLDNIITNTTDGDKELIKKIDINKLSQDLCSDFLNSLGNFLLKGENNTYVTNDEKFKNNIVILIKTINTKTADILNKRNLNIPANNLSTLYRRAILYYFNVLNKKKNLPT